MPRFGGGDNAKRTLAVSLILRHDASQQTRQSGGITCVACLPMLEDCLAGTPPRMSGLEGQATQTLDWPSGQGLQLQVQPNSLDVGLGTNWVDVTGAVPPYPITMDPTNGCVLYRLYQP
jgi:hypothetical protein